MSKTFNGTTMRYNMKKMLLLAAFATCFVVTLQANHITQSEALKLAETFVGRQDGAASVSLRTQGGQAKTKAVRLTAVDDALTAGTLYIFNNDRDGGFVIVSADDRAVNPIVGYADEGSFPTDEMPEAMREWLQFYMREAEAVNGADGAAVAAPRRARAQRAAEADGEPAEVAPLLGDIAWNQAEPYNRLTPLINGNHALTGCVATATAQIMYYHRWPERGTGSFSYDDSGSGKTLTADFSQHTYDWDAMLPCYDINSPRASGDAVALLMSDVGISLRMNYSLTFSGAMTSDVVPALRDHFGYDPAIFCVARRHYNYSGWTALMRRELAAGRPLVYSGSAPGANGGHAFVCDGYNADDYYHFNWGWSGSGNGWFLLSTMNPDGADGYTEDQEMVCNIARPGEAGDAPDAAFNWEFDAATGTLHCYGEGVMPDLGWMPQDKPWHEYMDQIKHVVVEEGITTVSVAAFQGISQLNTVTLSEGVEIIASEAFSYTPVTSITLPQSLRMIDRFAFRDTRLAKVDLGPNVESVPLAFAMVPTLKEITVSADNPYMTSIDGALYDKEVTTLIAYPCAAVEASLPSTLTALGEAAFYSSQITELVIPDQVTTLGDDVFNNAQMLRRVVLPPNLRVLPNAAFCNCYSLEEVVFNKALRNVDNWVFYSCYQLRSITLHGNVKRLSDSAFQLCSMLSEITCLAPQAPAINSNTFSGVAPQGVLTVPEGSDYSSWLDVLGPEWTVAYTEPEEPDPNGSWDGDVRVGYVNDGAVWTDNPLAAMYAYYYSDEPVPMWINGINMECAIRVDGEANAITRALGMDGRSLRGLSFMCSSCPVTSGKIWVSTSLPSQADKADIMVVDIPTDFRQDEWNDILFEQPVVLPDGPCYVGLSLVTDCGPSGLYWPFQFHSLPLADALEGDCFVRNSLDGPEWKREMNPFDNFHQVPAVRLCLNGHFMENDVAPLSAVDAVMLPGREGSTTLSLLQMGNESSIGSIGVRYYDSSTGEWGSTTQVTAGRTADNFGQRFYVEIPVPAKATAGCYVDSLAVTEINGYPCQHSQLAVPVTVNVLSQSLKHVHLVEFDMMATNGGCARAEVGRKLLEQTLGDDVITYTNHWGDHMSGRDKYPPLDIPGLALDARYLYNVDPYYGTGHDGFGLADYLRNLDEQPAVAEIAATAVWRNDTHTSLRLTSTIHTLVDLSEDRLSVRYIVVANGLHGTGDQWGQANAMSGETTDDPNLQPLASQSAFISDYVFDGVGIFCPWHEMSIESGQKQRLNVPQMKAGSTVELQHSLTADPNEYGEGGSALFTPEEYGIDYDNMYVIACIEDNLTRRIVNSVRVPLSPTPDIQADCVTAARAGNGGQVQIGDQKGKVVTMTSMVGNQLTLTAIPEQGYIFSYWSDGRLFYYENPMDYVVTDIKVFTAHFQLQEYCVSAWASEGGTVAGDTIAYAHYGDTIMVTATPYENYTFKYWEDDWGNRYYENPLRYTVQDNAILMAVFEDDRNSISILSADDLPGVIIYDLQGRRVLRPEKGFYIANGRKVMIR